VREAGGLIEFFPVGRVGKARHEIELPEQATHDMIAITSPADVIEPGDGLGQRRFGLGDRVLGIVFTLGLKAAFVLEEFFPIEVGSGN
jgi:hypothetical protein